MQKPTQALKSVKGQGHIFDWIRKWARTLPSLIYFSWDFHRNHLHKRKSSIKDGKVLDHLEIRSKVLPGPSTDLSAWVGFCTSSPQQGVKYQLWYLIFFYEGVLYKYLMKNTHPSIIFFSNIKVDIWRPAVGFKCRNPHRYLSQLKKYIKDGKVLAHLGLQSKVFSGCFTDISSWVGFCTSTPQQSVKYQLWYWARICRL
jgi:hypothetical protein